MDDNWDLYDIVRSYQFRTSATDGETPPITTAAGNSSSEAVLSCLASLTFEVENDPFTYSALQPNGLQEQDKVPKTPFATNAAVAATAAVPTVPGGFAINPSPSFTDLATFVREQNQSHPQPGHRCHPPMPLLTTSNLPCPLLIPAAGSNPAIEIYHYPHQPQLQLQQQRNVNFCQFALPNKAQPQHCYRQRRSFQQKKLVCQVPVDDVSIDGWAWRKYGQKLIKGSPFPRNYYRCSSLKECGARKHVERSGTEPGVYIVTYAGDHIHPQPTKCNSLVGATRSSRMAIYPNPYRYPVGNGLPIVPPSTLPANNEVGASGDHISANDSDSDMEMELAADDGDVLIPNTAAIDDDVLFDVDKLYSNGASTSNHAGGSSPGQSAFFRDIIRV